jgi:hypothetical protein
LSERESILRRYPWLSLPLVLLVAAVVLIAVPPIAHYFDLWWSRWLK